MNKMIVTQAERDQFEAIRQKMAVDQTAAVQEFAALAATEEFTGIVEQIEGFRDRCIAGSNEYTQLNNILLVVNSVRMQFPLIQTVEAPNPAPV
jgi:hypothetical protein